MNSSSEDRLVLITIDEAARRLSICRRTVEREIVHGRFPRPLKVGRSTRIAVIDLEAYVDRLRHPDARDRYVEASTTKQGAIAPSPEILALIRKHKPNAMSEEEFERLSSQYHRRVERELG